MSALMMTLLRVGFLILLWVFIYFVIRVQRRDLTKNRSTPHQAPPAATAPPSSGPIAPLAPQPPPGLVLGPTRLVVTSGTLAGTQIPMTTSAILIGRSPSCTLVLDDDYSSSRHARIFPRGEVWYVEDLGSTNGTFVGSERVTSPVALGLGSVVRVGQSTLELQR